MMPNTNHNVAEPHSPLIMKSLAHLRRQRDAICIGFLLMVILFYLLQIAHMVISERETQSPQLLARPSSLFSASNVSQGLKSSQKDHQSHQLRMEEPLQPSHSIELFSTQGSNRSNIEISQTGRQHEDRIKKEPPPSFYLHSFDFSSIQVNNTVKRNNTKNSGGQSQLVPQTSRRLHPNNRFTLDNVLDDPPDVNWNQTFADLISDENNTTACVTKGWWNNLEQALSLWIQIADDQSVPWFIAYGSLLGYARHGKTFISHDQDVDVVVPSSAYEMLLRSPFTTILPIDRQRLDKRGFLFLHPEFHHYSYPNRRGYLCNGTVTQTYDGACGFLRPLGRLFVRGQYVDIFTADHFPDNNDSLIYNEGYRVSITPASHHLPRRRCTFANLPCWCPLDYISVIRAQYGPTYSMLRPESLCNAVTKKHVTREQDPEFFKTKDEKFNQLLNSSVSSDKRSWTQEEKSLSLKRRKVLIKDFCSEISPLPPDFHLMTSMCRDLSK